MANDIKMRVSLSGVRNVISAFRRLKRAAKSFARAIGRTFRGVSNSVRHLGRNLRRLTIAMGALVGLTIKESASFETLKLRLKTVTGSAKEAEKVFNSLFKLSIGTQFTPKELIDAGILLRAFGQEGEDAVLAIGEAAAAMTKPIKDVAAVIGSLETEPLRRLGIEFEKVGTKGTATFRDKLGNEMSKTADGIDELRKMLLDVFSIKFGGTLKEASRTITGLLSTLKGHLQISFATVGDEISAVFKVFLDKLNSILVKFREDGTFKRLGEALEEFAIQFSAAVITMGQSFESFKNIAKNIGLVLEKAIILGFVKAIPILLQGLALGGQLFAKAALNRLPFVKFAMQKGPTAAASKELEDALAKLEQAIKPAADTMRDNIQAIKDEKAENKKPGAGEPGGDVLGGGVGSGRYWRRIGLGDLRKRRITANRLDPRKGLGQGFRTTSDANVKTLRSLGGSLKARAQGRLAAGFGSMVPQGHPARPPKLTSKQHETRALKQIARNTGALAALVGVTGGGSSGGGGASSGGSSAALGGGSSGGGGASGNSGAVIPARITQASGYPSMHNTSRKSRDVFQQQSQPMLDKMHAEDQ